MFGLLPDDCSYYKAIDDCQPWAVDKCHFPMLEGGNDWSWRSIEWILFEAWSYLKHPDGHNGQCEEEGVEQQRETKFLGESQPGAQPCDSLPVKFVQEHLLFIIFDIRRQKRRSGHRLRLTLHPDFSTFPSNVCVSWFDSQIIEFSEIFESLFLLLTIFHPFQNWLLHKSISCATP